MSDFKTRLLEEQAQLKERTEKLEAFLESDKINTIDNEQQILLSVQLTAMKNYLAILDMRIKLLKL